MKDDLLGFAPRMKVYAAAYRQNAELLGDMVCGPRCPLGLLRSDR